MFRTFHPKPAEYLFFGSTHGTFFGINHMLSHRTSPNKLKKIEIVSCILSNYGDMKLEFSQIPQKTHGKNTNTWGLNNMLLNNKWVKQKVKVEIKIYIYMETSENEQ